MTSSHKVRERHREARVNNCRVDAATTVTEGGSSKEIDFMKNCQTAH